MDLNVDYIPGFLDASDATATMQALLDAITFNPPEQSRVFVHGRWREIPRQQAAFGDPGTTYRFSGCTVPAQAWVESMPALRRAIAQRTGFDANFVLVNHYRNGADSIGWHCDDERDLGPAPVIVSLSLGAERDFQLRRIDPAGPGSDRASYRLQHGSLLVMRDPTNRRYKHQLPRRGGSHPECIGPRLNLTWRYVV